MFTRMSRSAIYNLLFLILFPFCIFATDGAWTNPAAGSWTTDANWTGPLHPNAPDAIAGFSGLPTAAGPIITSTTDITVGTLIMAITNSLTLDFGGNSLHFNSSFENAKIFASQPAGIGTGDFIAVGTPIVLDTDLDIFVNDAGIFRIDSSISGSGALNLYASSSIFSQGRLILRSVNGNTYTGGTNVNAGVLTLVNPLGNVVIPGDITIFQEGLVPTGTDNLFSPTTNMIINGGDIDLAGTTQTMNSISVFHDGSLTDGFAPTPTSILFLLAPPGPTPAISFGDNAEISITQINIVNGGRIEYIHSAASGTAFLKGTPSAPTIWDLGGFSVDFNIPHDDHKCIDVDLGADAFKMALLIKLVMDMLYMETSLSLHSISRVEQQSWEIQLRQM